MICALSLAATSTLGGCGDDGVAAHERVRVGLVANTLGFGDHLEEEQDRARAAGARWLREELSWAEIEPRPGERLWGRIDRMFTSAAEQGLRVLPLLNASPSWARAPDGGLPTDAAAYGAFVRDVVSRYGRSGSFWDANPQLDRALAPQWFELWNEPFLVAPQDSDIDARRYAALVVRATAAARPVDETARFLLALDSSTAARPGAAERWLDALVRTRPDVLSRVDAAAVHPYGIDPRGGVGGVEPLSSVIAALRDRRAELSLWITEVGWSTCSGEDVCVSEAEQATLLRGLFDVVTGTFRDHVSALFVYHLRDFQVPVEGGREGAFGLLRIDGSHKPAWHAYRRFADE